MQASFFFFLNMQASSLQQAMFDLAHTCKFFIKKIKNNNFSGLWYNFFFLGLLIKPLKYL